MVSHIVAYPESTRALVRHVPAAAALGTNIAVIYFLPYLALGRFQAEVWQVTVITAAVPVMQFFSIFWNHYYARNTTQRYLATLAVFLCLPTGAIALAPNIWGVLACFVLAAFGNAGMSPLNGDLLRSCYAPGVRARVFGVVTTAQFGGAALAGWIIGPLADRNPDTFRYFLPVIALTQVCGLGLLASVARQPLFLARMRPIIPEGRAWWTPLRDMRRVLGADRRFAAYEVAFMSYGIGWMICTALVPHLATHRLHLNYREYSQATISLFYLTHMLMLAPLGVLVGRIGPFRMSTASFLWLTIYPIGLLIVPDGTWLMLISVLYAFGMVGVNLTWTLGPVTLAPDSGRTSQYLAIHTTLVGVRGIVAQGIGMLLYKLTGSFVVPLVSAALAYLWAARRMQLLTNEIRAEQAAAC